MIACAAIAALFAIFAALLLPGFFFAFALGVNISDCRLMLSGEA